MFHEEKFRREDLYYNSVTSPGMRSQIRTPLNRLNRRTDGAASQISCLLVVKNSPGGVARCAVREKHPDVVSGCDWLLCEVNPIQHHLSRVMDRLAVFLNML
jgi:hypothetical protein